MRLGDLDALKEDFKSRLVKCNEWIEKAKDKETKIRASAVKAFIGNVIMTINNAPTVEYTFDEAFQKTVCENKLYCPARPQGEREFIRILAQNVPDDLCTYPEYRGKPYYSIHYKENGEEFVGFGTYNPEVLSRYLKEYFMKGGAEK